MNRIKHWIGKKLGFNAKISQLERALDEWMLAACPVIYKNVGYSHLEARPFNDYPGYEKSLILGYDIVNNRNVYRLDYSNGVVKKGIDFQRGGSIRPINAAIESALSKGQQ